MATRKPIVLGSDGRFQQLQAGDTLGGSFETGQVTQTAASNLIAGQPVYTSGADAVDKAKADAAGTSTVMGLATTAISSAASGVIQVNGILALTTAQWDALTGLTGGLVAGNTYYLSPATAGLIATAAPSTVGQYSVILGEAISTTEMNIRIVEKVLL